MAETSKIDWEGVSALTLRAGSSDEPKDIFRVLHEGIEDLVPHDFSQLVLLGEQDPAKDPFARPYGIVTLESRQVPEPHAKRYPYYFARTDLRPTALPERPFLFRATESGFVGTEFGEDWCRPVKAKHSAGMRFLDAGGRIRALLILYRERASLPFGERDLAQLGAVQPHIANLTRDRRQKPWRAEVEEELLGSLSAREREVAKLLCEGNSTKVIAGQLFITEATAHRHAHNIYEKLGIGSRQELLAMALKAASR
jgi:Response regulator containing a CheY-like receiver domain and an HTH DNA-binding domain